MADTRQLALTDSRGARECGWNGAQESFLRAAEECAGKVPPLLEELAGRPETALLDAPAPGSGRTLTRFALLASVAAADVTAARVLEPHLDAHAILAESGQAATPTGTWGVFAAEGPGAALTAACQDGEWTLSGTKPWCSLGGVLSHALVTAWTSADTRRLFRVELDAPSVRPAPVEWISRGLSGVPSGPLEFHETPAFPVGDDGWYLTRPGFAWGGIGVAACWWGGAVPVAQRILKKFHEREGELAGATAGRVVRALESGRLSLQDAADRIDRSEGMPREEARALSHIVRGTVADAVRTTLDGAKETLGPAVLGFDEPMARRIADLDMYATQYHAGRDDYALAESLQGVTPW
jgi:alkylation response protein AidB-like acyl-CoA dehydrogenase